jgi:hypothetical protein
MEFPRALSEQLSALTDALDHPGTDLQAVLAVLVDDLMIAVPSFLGLTLTLRLGGDPITLTAIDADRAATAGASLQLPLDHLAGAGPDSVAVFYAASPGAFVEMAAETRRTYCLDGQVVMDSHLANPATGVAGLSGLDDLATINQAVGVLIDQGHRPDKAHDELLRRADYDRTRLPETARSMLIVTLRPYPPAAPEISSG